MDADRAPQLKASVRWLLVNMKVAFNWSDAWLLLGILFASDKGAATLETIIAACDGIDHAIIEADELESGLVRLTEGGFITEKNGVFNPTKNQKLYSIAMAKRRAMHNRLKDIQKILNAPSAVSEQPSLNNLRYPGFSAENYEKAFQNYVG